MKKICRVILLLFSLLIISENEYKCISSENINFHCIERELLQYTSFVENGIKLQYTLKDKMNNEINRIYNILLQDNELEVQKKDNRIYANKMNLQYDINLFLQDNLLNVEIVIINKNNKIDTNMLKKIIAQFKSNNLIEERYFFIVKGKISEEVKLDKSMLINKEIEDTYKININNGVVYKFKFSNNEIINTSIVTYDTGKYVIIGTPIIFITY